MARVVMSLSVETDATSDVAGDLAFIFGALATRHGDEFRALQRRIETLLEEGLPEGCVSLRRLDDATLIAVPDGELKAIIIEARRLSIIN